MTDTERSRLFRHYDTYFEQSSATDCRIFHPVEWIGAPIDCALYPPNTVYPFYKLVTLGASDIRMPAQRRALGRRNEYILCIDARETLEDRAVLDRYRQLLLDTALYPKQAQTFISYGHALEWNGKDETRTVFLELPQCFASSGLLRCRLGLFKRAVCLQAVPLSEKDREILAEEGPQAFSSRLYPDEGTGSWRPAKL